MGAIAVIIIILSVLGAVMFIPLRVSLGLVLLNNRFSRKFEVRYGIIKIKTGKKRKKKDKKPKEDEPEDKGKTSALTLIKFLKDNAKNIKELVTALVKYSAKKLIRIEKISINALLGCDDAMETGLLYGATSAFLYNTLGMLDRCVATDKIRVEYKPVFGEAEIFIDLTCIIKTNLYKIIGFAAVGFVKAIPLIKKRGDLKNGKSDKRAC